MTRNKRYLVGVGNALRGDDGIGPAVIDEIARQGLDIGFEAVSALNDGMRVLSLFQEDTLRVVIVDCAFMGRGPGDCAVFDVAEARSRKVTVSTSTHGGDLLELIQRSETLGLTLPQVKFVGIEPGCLDDGAGVSVLLSRRIAEYVRIACEAVMADD